jgi:hypothetical protein
MVYLFEPLFFLGWTAPGGPGPPRCRGCTITLGLDTPHSVGLLWTSDQPDAKTCTRKHPTLTRDRYPCSGGIRTHNPSRRAGTDPSRLRTRGHSDRHFWINTSAYCSYSRCSRSSNAVLTSLYYFCHIELSFAAKLQDAVTNNSDLIILVLTSEYTNSFLWDGDGS